MVAALAQPVEVAAGAEMVREFGNVRSRTESMTRPPGGYDGPALSFGLYYHVGLAVPDLEAAMADLGQSLNLHWTSIESFQMREGQVRFAYSREGPPHLELLEGPPDTVWDSTDGGHMHHVGYWSTDIAADRDILAGRGLEVEMDGASVGRTFTYHRDRHGLRVELIDGRHRAAIEAWIGGAPLNLRPPPDHDH